MNTSQSGSIVQPSAAGRASAAATPRADEVSDADTPGTDTREDDALGDRGDDTVDGVGGNRVDHRRQQTARPVEIGGQTGPEPTRYGDWEKKGRCTDF